jgi:NAD(P)-dependent dehydrogenase (short-subunit alcohol dehydrogenase family)
MTTPTASDPSARRELIVISGASSGIGAATARRFASLGFYVLAGVRNPRDADAMRDEGIEPVMLDITIPEHVERLAARIADDPENRPLRALINNAGIEINAPIEVLPLELWRSQFEVNLFGHISVIQALLPFLRASRGRVVNISSVGGEAVLPIYGAYAATKFALEAASDALRREVSRQGIQVVIVQAGGVKTVMADRSGAISLALSDAMKPEHKRLYGHLIASAVASQTAFLTHALPASRAAAKIARVATTARPRARYTLGMDAAFVLPLNRLLPTRLMDLMLSGTSRRRGNAVAHPKR